MGLRGRVGLVGMVLAAVVVASQVAVAARPMRAVSRAADSVAVSADRWSIVPSATPSRGGGLGGVSCVSATDCTAVGDRDHLTLVEQWNGTVWSIVPSPSASGSSASGSRSSELDAVSCVSATDCTAVGAPGAGVGADGTLVEHWNGNKWSIIQSKRAKSTALSGVSCVSATDCTAVGSNATGVLAEHWNGKKWSVTPSPNRAGGYGTLFDVWCVSARNCIAVGGDFSDGGSTLVEHWNGTAWSIIPSPSPPKIGPFEYTGDFLQGVSCVTATDCTAVGEVDAATPDQAPLVEHWNGKAWSIVHSPNRSGSDGSLNRVSCVSATDCTAVGTVGTAVYSTLVEHWNGKTWSIIHSPNPAGGGLLSGVSCVTATHCTAVGTSLSSRTGGPLIEQESS
jgi:hypothetical protein